MKDKRSLSSFHHRFVQVPVYELWQQLQRFYVV